jgi:heterodisulfide reductase subunit A-like polyferredoxin
MPLLALQFYGPDKYPFHKGNRRAFLQSAACTGCGTCVDYCVFSARSVMGGEARIGECFGCGLCASHCPSGASRMV